MNKTVLIVVTLLISILATACNSQEQETARSESRASISGTITYRERIALSDDAVAEITLQDVSRADAAAVVIARQRISSPGQVPIHFELIYDPQDIEERMSYSIQAKISDHGQLMFINDTATPVLTRGAGNEINMTLVRVAARQELPGMELKGMFRYMADAALFRDCRDNTVYPVAMENNYIELERAYLNSGIDSGAEVMVKLRGRLLERPAMDKNSNEVMLIVDSFNNLYLDKKCTQGTHAELVGTHWKLNKLGEDNVETPEGMKEAYMILAGDESRVQGNAGCNNFFGQFTTGEETLSFSTLGSTMMACPAAMDTEQAFLAALEATARYEISGLFLELYDTEGTLLARLEAVYL